MVRYDVAAVAAAETFMLRLAVVLMVAGLGASGYAIVFPPPLGSMEYGHGNMGLKSI